MNSCIRLYSAATEGENTDMITYGGQSWVFQGQAVKAGQEGVDVIRGCWLSWWCERHRRHHFHGTALGAAVPF